MAEAQPISPFTPSTIEYMKNNKHLAGVYSAKVGVSAAAVLGSIANEYDTRYNPDLYAKTTGKLGQAIGDWLGSGNLGAMVITDAQNKYSHEYILKNYNDIKAGNPNPVPAYTPGWMETAVFKFKNPVLVDVGPGNIQIKTAIELVEKAYSAKMNGGRDDLDLAKYHGHYDTLVTDLLNFTKPETSFAIAAAVAKEAVQYLSNKDPAAWNKLSAEEKDAMVVVYYKMGEEVIDRQITIAMAEADHDGEEFEYSPQRSDGGEQHLKNIDTYRTLDYSKPAYTKCFSADTMISMADGSKKAISDIRVGDVVLAFGETSNDIEDGLTSRKVTNVFRNTTDQWLLVKGFDRDNKIACELTVTPGHLFLDSNGGFRKIEDIIASQGNIVTSQGQLLRVEGKRLNCTNENYELYEHVGVSFNVTDTNNSNVDETQHSWVTYNFEVEDLHTYIANDVRVHNDSVLDYLPDQAIITKIVVSSDGYVREAEYIRLKDGVKVYVIGADLDGNPTTTERLSEKLTIPPSANGSDDAIIEQVRRFDPKTGAEISREITDIKYTGVSLEQYATVLGSYLGTAIGGDNAIGQLAAGTLLSTLLGNLGEFIQAGTNLSLLEGSYFDGQLQSTDPFGDALNVTLKDFGKDLGNAVKGQVAGMISSILVAELAQAMDLDGVPATAFTTTGQAVTQQFLDNLTDVVLEKQGADLLKGFNNPEQLFANVGSAFGNLIASHLAGEIVTARSKEAALFGSAAGAILSLAMASIPVVGPFIGTFLGNTFGTLIGNAVFDNDDVANYRLIFDANTGKIGTIFYNQKDDGKLETALGMANQAAKHINDFVSAINAKIDANGEFNGAVLGYFVDHYNNKAAYSWGLTEFPVLNGEGASVAIAAAQSWSFKTLDLIIPDPIVRRAYYASRDDGTTQLGLDIKVAQDYRKYIENTSVISAVINADPDSAFAAGWAITLLRARELGLNRGSVNDFKGGFYLNLKDHETVQGPRGMAGGLAPERLAWTPDLDVTDVQSGSMKTGDLLLTSLDGLSTIRADNVFGPGAVVTRLGDNTTTAVNGSAINAPDASVIYIRAGDGAKTVNGSANQGSIIVGGEGTQILIGGKGNDWLRGGKNNTELRGGAGDDLLVAGGGTAVVLDGGTGRNTYYLGPNDATVRISALDTKGSDTIIATLAGALSDKNAITFTAKGAVSGLNVTKDSSFSRSGADLVISTRTADARDGYGKIVVENFFLRLNSIDTIAFSDGTLQNIDIWNKVGVRTLVNELAWNTADETRENILIDGADTQGNIYAAASTKTSDGTKTLFDIGIYDDGSMHTVAYDPGNEHDWAKWLTEYTTAGDIKGETVTLDAKSADGNAVVITRGTGGVVAGSGGNDVLRSATAGSTLIGDRGNDSLSGSGGSDLLYGGSGDDRYIVGTGDRVFEFTGEGTDVVEATVSYALAAGQSIEELRLADPAGTTALNLTGNELDNTLVGNAGANFLDGGNGGADKIDGGDGTDTVSYASSGRGVTIDMQRSLTWDGAKNDTLTSIENAIGSAFDDTLAGDAAGNVLDGGAGADKINGGGGIDTVSYASANRRVSVDLSKGIASDGTSDTLTSMENATGSAFDDTLVGDANANVLDGGAGADTINGGDGIDTVSYASASRKVSVDLSKSSAWDGANDMLTSIENATGSAFDDTLVGDANLNILDGAGGNDAMRGGLGNDTYVVDATGDTVTEVAGEGTDGIRTTLTSYSLGAEIENLRYIGGAAFSGTGNALANAVTGAEANDTLNGGAGNDVLNGLGGDDRLIGGTGNDTYYIDSLADQVFEADNGGSDTVLTAGSYMLMAGQEIETLQFATTTATTALDLTGNERANTLNGNAGINVLDGGDGNDVLRGGGGDDTYLVDNASDQVFEGAAGGDDTVVSENSFTLAAGQEIETLRLANPAGTVARSLAGNEFDNTLIGNAGANYLGGGGGDDTLDGGSGNDTMRGGEGDDTYRVDNASDQVFEEADGGNDTVLSDNSFTLAAGQAIEVLRLANPTGTVARSLAGNEFDNTLIGNAGDNYLGGGAGNDTLDGGVGSDTMRGGLGNDVYVVDATGDTVTENAGEGTDGIRTTLTSFTLGAEIESLRYYGSAAFTGTGNALANAVTGAGASDTLSGGAGNDVLNGLGGDDRLIGGSGNDTYVVDSTGDTVTEAASGGIDELQTNLGSYGLGAEVENLRYVGSADFSGTGNALDNTLTGRGGNDTLNGGAGDDVLLGGTGDDTYRVDNFNDQVFEAEDGGRDTILSDNSFALAAGQEIEVLQLTFATGTTARGLSGNEFANTLIGNAGSNGLNGGGGSDVLTGNGGSDTFQFRAALGSTNVDRITDFGSDDSILLDKAYMTGLSAGALASGAFKNISQTAADADDRILYKQTTGELFYDADGSGSGAAVRFAILDNKAALSYQDFLVA